MCIIHHKNNIDKIFNKDNNSLKLSQRINCQMLLAALQVYFMTSYKPASIFPNIPKVNI